MSKMRYRQYTLTKDGAERVLFLPVFVKVGEMILLENEDNALPGWKVVYAGDVVDNPPTMVKDLE